MEGCRRRRGYAWAISAGLNAALAAVSAKLFSSQVPDILLSYKFQTSIRCRIHCNEYKVLTATEPTNNTLPSVRKFGWSLYSHAWDSTPNHFNPNMLVKYGLVIFFNVVMWGCYVNSLKALPSLQATVTNFATNFLSSGLAGFFLFKEPLSSQWFGGALLIVLGVFVLSKSSIDRKARSE